MKLMLILRLFTVYSFVNRASTKSPTRLTAAVVTIEVVGKAGGGESSLWASGINEYSKRLKPHLTLSHNFHKTDEAQLKKFNDLLGKRHGLIVLDPLGLKVTSEEFATQMYSKLESGGNRLSFIIGGASGLPVSLQPHNLPKNDYTACLSLSDLTFTHSFVRLLLTEQIYRSTQIKAATGYHK